MNSDRNYFELLLKRAESAFRVSTPTEVVGGRKAIVGPLRPDVLAQEAEEARRLLREGGTPNAIQLASLEQVIRLQRPAPPCLEDDNTNLPTEGNWLQESWRLFQPTLKQIQVSVARIERVDDPEPMTGTGRTILGTGFLVSSDMILTAAHVVEELSFSAGSLEPGQAFADFKGYASGGGHDVHKVLEIVAIDETADLALLRIDTAGINDKPILRPSCLLPKVGQAICVVGFPLEDPRNPTPFVSLLFGSLFGVKRAAIGEVVMIDEPIFVHDATTLGGNSGSPIFDIVSGRVCGVHVGGRAWTRNEAVIPWYVEDFVARFLSSSPQVANRRSIPMKKPFNPYYHELLETDPAIAEEMEAEINETPTTESATGESKRLTRETIVLTKGRPVLDIKESETVIDIAEVESQIWKKRLSEAVSLLAPNIPAVGRIELTNHPRGVEWLGTGWLIRDNIIVTNRHVAEVFGEADGEGFVFRPGFDGTLMQARIDFLEEFENETSREFPFYKVVHIERSQGPDLAFLRIEPANGASLPNPVTISSVGVELGEHVAVIGYPARDPFFPEPDVMDRIFNHRYDKKRLAPGMITGKKAERIFHDCSTLGGNSGGEVVSLKTGHAVALHFAGTLFTKNHAVPIDLVASRLDDLLFKRPLRTKSEQTKDGKTEQLKVSAVPSTGRFVEATVPVRIRVEIGDVTTPDSPSAGIKVSAAVLTVVDPEADDDLIEITEVRPEDYTGRDGYDANFLESPISVPLPELIKNNDDALKFTFNGDTHQVLHYTHFSVLMSKSRRMCRYSACNIDGKQSQRTTRSGWQFDPRIPKDAQIMKECYGNPPKFSRGHMTRREDPAWGSDADLGNRDSMHVTNAVPQIQPFNAGIWLNLEDYALQNARKDDMRISVFTGPFLSGNDPKRFDIKVPISFWKVIAFIHDETGELCALGYTMSQKSFIGEEEFVFGRHENNQRPIAEIERRAGISFGPLAELDPLKDTDEAIVMPLYHRNQIKWK